MTFLFDFQRRKSRFKTLKHGKLKISAERFKKIVRSNCWFSYSRQLSVFSFKKSVLFEGYFAI